MDDDALRRALRSVGYRCFIVYKDVFLDTSIPMDAAARHLHVTEKTWSMGGCLMRVSQTGALLPPEKSRYDLAGKDVQH